MLAAAFLTIVAVAVHWGLVQAFASTWLVPDLTLVAVVWVAAMRPRQGWLAAASAGVLTMGWMPEGGLLPVIGYGSVVLLVRWLANFWNMVDWRGQLLVVGFCEALWIALQLWMYGTGWASVIQLGLWHIAVTVLAARITVLLGQPREAEVL